MSGASTSKAHNGPRSVTLLGATGSIGGSTIDLLLHARDRYRVEAVVASRNAGALAALARKIGARFAAIADPSCYAELKEGLAGSGIAAAAGEGAVIEAATSGRPCCRSIPNTMLFSKRWVRTAGRTSGASF